MMAVFLIVIYLAHCWLQPPQSLVQCIRFVIADTTLFCDPTCIFGYSGMFHPNIRKLSWIGTGPNLGELDDQSGTVGLAQLRLTVSQSELLYNGAPFRTIEVFPLIMAAATGTLYSERSLDTSYNWVAQLFHSSWEWAHSWANSKAGTEQCFEYTALLDHKQAEPYVNTWIRSNQPC